MGDRVDDLIASLPAARLGQCHGRLAHLTLVASVGVDDEVAAPGLVLRRVLVGREGGAEAVVHGLDGRAERAGRDPEVGQDEVARERADALMEAHIGAERGRGAHRLTLEE